MATNFFKVLSYFFKVHISLGCQFVTYDAPRSGDVEVSDPIPHTHSEALH